MHETESFWQGDFGDKYTSRNIGNVRNNEAMFAKIQHAMFEAAFLTKKNVHTAVRDPESVIEFGAGSGENILAMKARWTNAHYSAVEINPKAYKHLSIIKGLDIHLESVYDVDVEPAEVVLTKGLLIHIPPERINDVYDQLYKHSRRYIVICEYYNPVPVEVPYRGHAGRLWKRDFAGEMLDRFKGLRLVDYGFKYHRDRDPQDDITWFILEKGA
ncbi:MAG TPA: pseudaminic acid biosynthesis-associated methylase [Dissulfurispiraceae bacterium]|nr:pseudaminic acid biosynthesis-associated methylase [Dissulfurispiraceae bacterium]